MKAFPISVTINEYGKKIKAKAQKGERLKEILLREGVSFSLPCAGVARCGKCRVRFLGKAPAPGIYEEEFLTEKEVSEGLRLLCRCVVYEDCEVEIPKTSTDMAIETIESSAPSGRQEGAYGIAVDLGTTTIAAALIRKDALRHSKETDDHKPGVPGYQVLRTSSCINSQRKYGADVISRISAAEDSSALEDLSDLAASDIESLVKELSAAEGISFAGKDADLKAITIAGNTTMLNLLAGRDVSGLGRYPYKSDHLSLERMTSDTILPNIPDIKLTLLPGISGFVGGDIVAGLFALGPESEEKFFFLDLGTNGEMAFYDGEELRVTSTAAGPVFEAGGISAGVASVPGAISHVEIEAPDQEVNFETIGNKAPIGICGTGVMEIVSELADKGIIDETGLLSQEYFEEGFPITADGKIRFTQQDIRNVQLAKAAVLTGAKALLQGKVPDKVYIAGGFGTNIRNENITKLKMFPKEFDGKIVAVGNLALKGTALFTSAVLGGWEEETDAVRELDLITKTAKVTELATLDSFDEDYIDAMNFEMDQEDLYDL